MEESPAEYAERVLAYCMKATKPLDVNDPALNRMEKANITESKPKHETDVFNAMLKAYDQPIASLTKATQPKTSNEAIDSMLKAYGV